MADELRHVTVVLFEGFELLDVFGPVELFSRVPELLSTDLIGPGAGPVTSNQGTTVIATRGYDDAAIPDIALIPGGQGTRQLVEDTQFLEWLHEWARPARLIASVCTGSAVLAAAGLLDGHRATSNKASFGWASKHGENVTWVPQARWVEDRDRWTSSGVAAGMDMAAALLSKLYGRPVAQQAAAGIELEIHEDPSWDPFAQSHGLSGMHAPDAP